MTRRKKRDGAEGTSGEKGASRTRPMATLVDAMPTELLQIFRASLTSNVRSVDDVHRRNNQQKSDSERTKNLDETPPAELVKPAAPGPSEAPHARKHRRQRPKKVPSTPPLTFNPYTTSPIRPKSPPPTKSATIVLPSTLTKNSELLTKPRDNPPLLKIRHSGITDPTKTVHSDDADLIVGFDFGSSSVKAVIGDNPGKRRYLVEFTDSIDDRYLLRTRIFRNNDRYSLEPGGVECRDLKLRLIAEDQTPSEEDLDHACAFIALALRRVRGWFHDRHSDEYRDARLFWSLNIGVPARSYENMALVSRIREIAWAAANLSADPHSPQVTRAAVKNYRALSRKIYQGARSDAANDAFPPDTVDVVPEIAAEVYGFVSSARFDPQRQPYVVIYDVGAGTTDTALLAITETRPPIRKKKYVFFASDVQPLGAVNLHRARIDWLRKLISSVYHLDSKFFINYLDEVMQSTYSLRRIPESVDEYLPGARINVTPPDVDVDRRFRQAIQRRFAEQIFSAIKDHGISRMGGVELPFFLCGGGSRHPLYSQIGTIFNKTQNSVRLIVERLPMPEDLSYGSLPKNDFDRVAVAYGLSIKRVGEIIRKIDVPPLVAAPAAQRADFFVSKDEV